jgi:hypothetical protein
MDTALPGTKHRESHACQLKLGLLKAPRTMTVECRLGLRLRRGPAPPLACPSCRTALLLLLTRSKRDNMQKTCLFRLLKVKAALLLCLRGVLA